MKLYFSPGACSLASHIVLREAGVKFDLKKVDLNTHLTEDGKDFYAINKKGQVPVLELDDGSRLTEGPVLAQYIADLAPARALIPAASTMARYQVAEWQNYITAELHKSFTPLFNPQIADDAKKTLSSLLRKKYEWVNTQLAQQKFLHGNQFSIADAYLFVVTGWSKYVGLDLSDLKNLQDYLLRISLRPAVQEAMKAEGLAA
jgi:glutathione S-transferase